GGPVEPGVGDDARVRGEGADARVTPEPVELPCEEDVRRLRLRVGERRVVTVGAEVRVVPEDARVPVRTGGGGDHAGAAGGQQHRQQPERELEVTEVVGREPGLVTAAVVVEAAGGRDARVVDEKVDGPTLAAVAEIGRASCRERVEVAGVDGAGKKERSSRPGVAAGTRGKR